MNRNSKKARLAEAATGVPARRIERQSIAGLIPDDVDGDELVAHVTALQDVAGQGREVDAAALLLAARHGLGCPRLPDAILRALNVEGPSAAMLGAEVERGEDGEITDTGWIEVERRAGVLETSSSTPGSDGAAIEDGLRRQALAAARTLGETPEAVLHSVMTTVAAVAAGDGPVMTAPLAGMVLGPELGAVVEDDGTGSGECRLVDAELAGFDAAVGTLGFDPQAVYRYVTTTAPEQLAAAAHSLWRSGMVQALAPMLGAGASEEAFAAVLGSLLGAMGAGGTSPLVGEMLGALASPTTPPLTR